MIRLLKDWLLLNSSFCLTKQRKLLLSLFCLFGLKYTFSQVNCVGNPSFETYLNCSSINYISIAKYWNSIDSIQLGAGGDYYNTCYPNVPLNGATYQEPKTGNAYIRTTFLCQTPDCTYPNLRTYPKNRLKKNLISNKTYCVKMHVNLTNTSPYAIDGLGMYIGDSSIDTIKYCMLPLTYLIPQIQQPTNIIINDTVNWIGVSGTFTANGQEKYLLIGNFKTDGATSKILTGVGTGIWSEYVIDDVSIIDYNLPAYAGPDNFMGYGDSVFIGRPPEIGLECTWYNGTVTVGTGGGIWVKPANTSTYVVKQNICGLLKTDTVVIYVGPIGIKEAEIFAKNISIYPQPARDLLTISIGIDEKSLGIKIFDLNGKLIECKDLIVEHKKVQLSTASLANGVYVLQIKNSNDISVSKRLVISR